MANGETAPTVLIEEINSTIKRIQAGDEEALPSGVILLLRCQKAQFSQVVRNFVISGVTSAIVAGVIVGVALALGL